MTQKLFIASDHGGYDLKEYLKSKLTEQNIVVQDLGTDNTDSVNYPDYGIKLCKKVLETNGYGILICGTGIGMSITANKFKGIYAALCTNEFMAEMAKRHNNSNVLVLGGRVLGTDFALNIVNKWLSTEFDGGRHENRIGIIKEIE